MTNISLQEFAERLSDQMSAMSREFLKKQSNELYKGRITLPQFVILDFLFRHGGSKMTDLAHSMEVTTAAMTGIIDRLVKCGYVVRSFDPADRRIIKISLKSKGAELVKKITRQKRQMIIDVFGKITQDERNEYLRILGLIHQILLKKENA